MCVAEDNFYLNQLWDPVKSNTSAITQHDVIDFKVRQQPLLVMPTTVIKPQVV